MLLHLFHAENSGASITGFVKDPSIKPSLFLAESAIVMDLFQVW